MDGLPARGAEVRRLGLALPPARMPLRMGTRPLKRWRYVGVYTPELMLCVGDARIGGIPQRWWAVALPGGQLHERTTVARGGVIVEPGRVSVRAPGVTTDLALDDAPAVETASPAGDSYIWTAKRANVGVRGTVTVDGAEHRIDAPAGFIDESAGYHPRYTAWRWSAGVGRLADGRAVGWNLVDGIHDSPRDSERTVWVDSEPHEVGPAEFAPDLSSVGGLGFSAWSAREENRNLLLLRSRYRQPFGTFTGSLPGGEELAEGFGVMEEHEAWW